MMVSHSSWTNVLLLTFLLSFSSAFLASAAFLLLVHTMLGLLCFQWTNDMAVSINWEAFSQAFRSQYRFRVFTFKLCFWQLPTGKTLHRGSPRFNPKCPTCSHASKCNNHMFQCKAISCRRWKTSFIQSTHKRAQDCKTDPKLLHVLLAGIRSYFNSCSPPCGNILYWLMTDMIE
jgi:hypothetical protein